MFISQPQTQTPTVQPLPQPLVNEIAQNRQKYLQLSQIALYASLQPIQQLQIFTKSTCDVECSIVFCFHGQKYQPHLRQQIQYYIIRILNEQIPKIKGNGRFSLAYVHDSVSGYLMYRGVVKLMPKEFMGRLKDVYIVGAGVGLRIVELFSFGEIYGFFRGKSRWLERQILGVQEIQMMNKIILGGDVVSRSKMKLQAQRESHRTTLMHTKQHESSDTSLIRNALYGKQLSQYQLSQTDIPIYIEYMVTKLYSNAHYLKAEGIMRKNCDIEQLEVLEAVLIENAQGKGMGQMGQGMGMGMTEGIGDWRVFVEKIQDPYVICGCIKKIFNNLNTPLFSYEIYDMILSYRSEGQLVNDLTFVRNCVSKMPKLHRHLAFYMFAFLKKGIVTYQQFNKMSPYNLAVVFGPCFFRPKQYKLQSLMASGKYSFIIKLFIQNFQEIAGEDAYIAYNLLQSQKQKYREH